MNARLFAVTRREYVSIVTRKSFWLGTLLIPLLIVVLGGISALSAKSAKQSEKAEMGKAKHIEVDDPGHMISDRFLVPPIQRTSDREAALAEVKAGRIDALIVYPAVLNPESHIAVHAKETWITQRDRFEPMAKSLLKDSILDRVGDPNLIAVYNAKLPIETISYKDGLPAKNISALIVPGSFIALFYMLLIMSSNTLLTSMTEEKENRVIEVLLTSIRTRELLFCKLLGLAAVGITQLVLTLGLALGVGAALHTKLPFNIDFAKIVLDPVTIGLGFFYTISGYMLYAAIMAGVGASVPTAREAGGLVAFFLICALSPFYFITALVAEPTGTTAIVTSYFPLTAPLVLVLRNALGALSPLEIVTSMVAMCAYIGLAFMGSVKLFELGALEYGQRLSFKRLFAKS
ncbi:MAG TPA: ABC transporter permease [Planctomycetota bacterium]|jgi:ABC-2 type transport system permease protein|nr:ABC transporter permease [Planctomycetota bacterium]